MKINLKINILNYFKKIWEEQKEGLGDREPFFKQIQEYSKTSNIELKRLCDYFLKTKQPILS